MKKTFDYKTLKGNGTKGLQFLAGINRSIIPSHVTSMSTSLEKMGIIRPVVVSEISFLTGTPTNYIIDGQHLYMGLIRLGWDVPYTEIEIKNPVDLAEHLALLNNSSKSWSLKDYIQVWSNIRKDYVILNQYHTTYDVELSQVAQLLMDGECSYAQGGNSVTRLIKRGDFKVKDEQRGKYLLDCITDALKIIGRMDRGSNKLFISSYVSLINAHPNYLHTKYMTNLKRNKDKFKLATLDPEEYKKLLNSIL